MLATANVARVNTRETSKRNSRKPRVGERLEASEFIWWR
jgi:hypothetical protein